MIYSNDEADNDNGKCEMSTVWELEAVAFIWENGDLIPYI